MKYYNYDIVFQEVPNEVTLAINISNCPNRCEACHSPHLWEDVGVILDENELDVILSRYADDITCVCFMGGDGSKDEVEKLAAHVRKTTGLKVAWYSGRYDKPLNINNFDYIKLGPFIPDKGGLKSKDTNQRFFKVINKNLIDITEIFTDKIK